MELTVVQKKALEDIDAFASEHTKERPIITDADVFSSLIDLELIEFVHNCRFDHWRLTEKGQRLLDETWL